MKTGRKGGLRIQSSPTLPGRQPTNERILILKRFSYVGLPSPRVLYQEDKPQGFLALKATGA